MDVFWIENANVLEVRGLQDVITKAFLNSRDVEVTLLDLRDRLVPGVVWPLTVPYVAASDGLYQVEITTAVELRRGVVYVAEVNLADAVPGEEFFVRHRFRVEERTIGIEGFDQ